MSAPEIAESSPFVLANGEATVVFTDIEGYSLLEGRFGPQLAPLLREHNALLDALVLKYGGYRSRIVGDAFFVVFARPLDAVQFATEAQREIQRRQWFAGEGAQRSGVELRVRIGMHTGRVRVEEREGERADFFGDAVNMAARVSSAAHGAQILISEATRNGALAPKTTVEIEWLDLGRHELKGVGEARLFQVVASGLRADFPPPRVPLLANHNIPHPLTALLGREGELETLMVALDEPKAALITLCGFGGIGKTRLALELANRIVDAPDFKTKWSDGAWWVALEAARDAESFVRLVAEALPLEARPHLPLAEQVAAFLRPRRLWLFLDNLEQLERAEVALLLATWLKGAPHLRIVTTSRAALELEGERVYEIESLEMEAACALFEERTKARRGAFRIEDRNRADVEALCAWVDGMPLGIELVAAQALLLAPRQILARLKKNWDAFTARDTTRPTRQTALSALIEWSFELLGASAREVLPQLSVYEGGFTLESVAGVVQCSEGDVFEAFSQLRTQSLVRVLPRAEGQDEGDAHAFEERFGLLEPIRHFAAWMLHQDLNRFETEARHCAFFVAELERFERRADAGDEIAALRALRPEWANCGATWRWLCDNDQSGDEQDEIVERYALRWSRVLQARGFWAEARAVTTEALALLPESAEKIGRIELRLMDASLAFDQGELETAHAGVEAALATIQSQLHSDEKALWLARALNLRGLVRLEMELAKRKTGVAFDFEVAARDFARALGLCPANACFWRAKMHHNSGRIFAIQGHSAEARTAYEAALRDRKRAHDLRGEALTMGNLGALWQDEGEDERARALYEASLTLRHQLDEPLGIATMLNNLGELAHRRGENAEAIELLEKSHLLFERIGSPLAAVPVQTLTNLKKSS